MHRALDDVHPEPLRRIDAEGTIVIVFRMHGRHTGPLATPLGEIAPTGRPVEIRTIDVLTVTEGRISEVWVVADELSMLTGLGAVTLA